MESLRRNRHLSHSFNPCLLKKKKKETFILKSINLEQQLELWDVVEIGKDPGQDMSLSLMHTNLFNFFFFISQTFSVSFLFSTLYRSLWYAFWGGLSFIHQTTSTFDKCGTPWGLKERISEDDVKMNRVDQVYHQDLRLRLRYEAYCDQEDDLSSLTTAWLHHQRLFSSS